MAFQTERSKLYGYNLKLSSKGKCREGRKVSIQPCWFVLIKNPNKSSYQQAAYFLPKLTFFIYNDELLLKQKEFVFVLGQ